jgi:hypothetical protein
LSRSSWFQQAGASSSKRGERLSYKQEAAGSSPASPITRGCSSEEVERSPETRRAQVRVLPATLLGSVAQSRAADSYSARCRFESCRGHLTEGLPSARYPVSKTRAVSAVEGSTPSPSARGSAPVRRGRAGRRATVNREAQVRALPPELDWLWGRGHPAGFGNRRPLVRLQPARPFDARWRSGFPREPHELETWVRIPPAQSSGA